MKANRIVFLQRDWEDNLGVLWLVASLNKEGFDARVLIEEKHTIHELQELEPNIVAYSCMTGQQKWVLNSICKLRAAGLQALFIAGGPHPTFYPQMVNNKELDCVFRGEGEDAIIEFMKRYEGRGDLKSSPNTVWRTEDGLISNPMLPLRMDLDTLPFPDRSYYGRYSSLAMASYRTCITSRGCPFQCTFCFNHALHKMYGTKSRYVRRHSVEYTLAELRRLKKNWGIKELRFSDDHFVLDQRWLEEFIPRYCQEIGSPFVVNARVDALDEDKIRLLAEGGCRLVCFGIETGNEAKRNTILNKNILDEQIISVSALLKKYGICTLASNIIGLPGETPQEAWQTIHLNQKIGTDLPWYSLMQYYPGTKIYEQAKFMGLISNDFDASGITSYFRNTYLHQPHMDELINIHRYSILATWFPFLEHPLRFLAEKIRPNAFSMIIFKICYAVLTFRRTHISIRQVFSHLGYYIRRLMA